MLKMCPGLDDKPCGALIDVRAKRCPTCLTEYNRQKTAQSRARGYRSAGWQTVAKRFLEHHPHCAQCGEPSRIAHHLHGLRPVDPGGTDVGMLQALCNSCHQRRHAELRRQQKKEPSL